MTAPAMPASGLLLTTAITQIIQMHQPDEEHDCWANERFCKGCTDFSEFPYSGQSFMVWPWSEFPKHQAQLISQYIRDRNGTR